MRRKRKQTLVVTKIEFLPVADDATKTRILAVFRLLLQPSKSSENEMPEENRKVKNAE